MKLYALIISNEDYVDTTLFDNLQKVTEAFDNIPGTRSFRFDNQDRIVIAELDGLEYSFGFGSRGNFYGGQIVLENN